MIEIEIVWRRLSSLSGELFHTKTGKPFKFKVEGDRFYQNRTDYTITKGDFEKALKLVPIKGPGLINMTVNGPAYVWAVLHDPRVRQQNW
ncbi:hypothetical protein [Pseudovibrio ascidiaceicola]|uniref:hypothetical protein n=1 Tax=Pseudovibrio ascidiaceicola TaxID=285279 RepID=UPI000D697477|nr:hypothetical protein [Pseudovibrio ascidiaceicola]